MITMNFSKKIHERKNNNKNFVSKESRLTAVMAMAFLSLFVLSCTDVKKDDAHDHSAHSDMKKDEMVASHDMLDSSMQNSGAQMVLADYMVLKDALVETNQEKAAEAGKKLMKSLNEIDSSGYTAEKQKELEDIISDAKEHAEHISRSEIDRQREHFRTLSKNVMDMVAITGTENTLYQQFCPMYDGGGAWLSMNEEILNPYFGSKMLKCGTVQKQIN